MRLAVLLSMCHADLEEELTAQQHLFPEQMKPHIVTVINSRTRGLAPTIMGNLSDEDGNHPASSDEFVESEDGELYRLKIRNGKKVFTESRHEPRKGKGGGKGKTDRMFPLWTHWSHQRQIAGPKLTSMGTLKICAQREKCWQLRARRNRDLTKCAIGDHRFWVF